MLPDAMAALLTFLGQQASITALVETRLFGMELPDTEIAAMPRKAMVLRWAGGLIGSLPEVLHSRRVDVHCYGETPYEAERLHRTVYPILKGCFRQVVGDVMVHNVAEAGGAVPVRDPTFLWPSVVQSWAVIVDDRAVA
jgi:hypothetical protein